jgi:hypothetical protein
VAEPGSSGIIGTVKFLRMKPGHGEVLLAEGDVEVKEDERALIEEFRRQLDQGMWAAVPTSDAGGHHEATMVRDFSEIPRGAERVIFFPRAAGGAPVAAASPPDLPVPAASAGRHR